MAPKAMCGRQLRRCRSFDGNYTVLGSWFAAGAPCALSVREGPTAITKNISRFLPHAIVA